MNNKRIVFFRAGQTITLPEQSLPYISGVPLSNGSTLKEHLKARDLVGNLGNMIHRMAMIQMTECDRANSSQINMFKFLKHFRTTDEAITILEANFDALVITMSNILRKDASEPGIAELVDKIKIPVYCVGIGLQNELPLGDETVLSKNIVALLKVLDKKASLFGVRGEQSLEWLRSIGIKNAVALGCPSMFAYPENILSIEAPTDINKIITAGHLQLTTNSNSRGHRLMHGLEGVYASYVFQGELAYFKELYNEQGIYDEATQSLNTSRINQYLKKKCGIEPPFSKYYSFGESSAWRQACSNYDLYIGDRIHGGVAAMQAGKPALILYEDARVQELTNFHGIPSCSLKEFEMEGYEYVVRKYLNVKEIKKFKAKYKKGLLNFEKYAKKSGLSLTNRISI